MPSILQIYSVPNIFQVGYTNAGKSTLLNRLTGADVLAEDKLFATLDPTTRRVLVCYQKTLLIHKKMKIGDFFSHVNWIMDMNNLYLLSFVCLCEGFFLW